MGSYHNSSTSPDGTAPHRNVLSVYGFLAKRRTKEAEPSVITAQTHRACGTQSASLTHAASPTAFSVRNLHRNGKLPVGQETTDRSARTPLFKPSTPEHVTSAFPPVADSLSEATGAEWQTAVFLLHVSSLFKQSGQTVGTQLGRLPCRMETALEQRTTYRSRWSFEGLCYLIQTSARCSSHTATYSAEGAAGAGEKRLSFGFLLYAMFKTCLTTRQSPS